MPDVFSDNKKMHQIEWLNNGQKVQKTYVVCFSVRQIYNLNFTAEYIRCSKSFGFET